VGSTEQATLMDNLFSLPRHRASALRRDSTAATPIVSTTKSATAFVAAMTARRPRRQ
jgi:hypothetical protein